ncbi:MAG: alpha/beta hydrolase [Anaerolineae bacterium]
MKPSPTRTYGGPPLSYTAALRWIAARQAEENDTINPLARTCLFTHGSRVERAVVLLHGYTSSPAQFHALGNMLHERGCNVLIPRAPHHGLADRLTAALARLDEGELLTFLDDALEMARGLGEHIVVAGLSLGGLLTAWAAQERADVSRAVLIAPAIGFSAVPAALTPLAGKLACTLPNVFLWWDPVLKDRAPGPRHGYPRYATRPLGHILRISRRLQARAVERPPAAGAIAVITNACDRAVDNAATARLVRLWQAHGAQVSTYEFPADLDLPHDLIDPAQPHQRTERVYPTLLQDILI